MASNVLAPRIFLDFNTTERRIVIEPSFSFARLKEMCMRRLEEIHTTYGVEVTANRVVVWYTRGFEVRETLAAVIAIVADCGNVNVDELLVAMSASVTMKTFAMVKAARNLGVLIQAESHLVEALKEATEEENRVRYAETRLAGETDNRNSLVKGLRELRKFLKKASNGSSNDLRVLVESIEWHEEQLVASRSYILKEGPKVRGRRRRINNRLARLDAEARALRPLLGVVRPELRAR